MVWLQMPSYPFTTIVVVWLTILRLASGSELQDNERWYHPDLGLGGASYAVDHARLYRLSTDGVLSAINSTSGLHLWTQKDVGHDGTLAISSNYIYTITKSAGQSVIGTWLPGNGALVSQTAVEAQFYKRVCASSDGIVLGSDSRLQSFAPNGHLRWTHELSPHSKLESLEALEGSVFALHTVQGVAAWTRLESDGMISHKSMTLETTKPQGSLHSFIYRDKTYAALFEDDTVSVIHLADDTRSQSVTLPKTARGSGTWDLRGLSWSYVSENARTEFDLDLTENILLQKVRCISSNQNNTEITCSFQARSDVLVRSLTPIKMGKIVSSHSEGSVLIDHGDMLQQWQPDGVIWTLPFALSPITHITFEHRQPDSSRTFSVARNLSIPDPRIIWGTLAGILRPAPLKLHKTRANLWFADGTSQTMEMSTGLRHVRGGSRETASRSAVDLSDKDIYYARLGSRAVEGWRKKHGEDKAIEIWAQSLKEGEEVSLLDDTTSKIPDGAAMQTVSRFRSGGKLLPLKISNKSADTIKIRMVDLKSGRLAYDSPNLRASLMSSIVSDGSRSLAIFHQQIGKVQEIVNVLCYVQLSDDGAAMQKPLEIKEGHASLVGHCKCVRVPFAVSAMQFANSRQNIAEGNLIVASTSGSLIRIPLRLLEAGAQEIGRDYTELLKINERLIISDTTKLGSIHSIYTSGDAQESKIWVLAHGDGLFGASITPSSGFDVLSPEFSKSQLVFTLTVLFMAALILGPLVSDRVKEGLEELGD